VNTRTTLHRDAIRASSQPHYRVQRARARPYARAALLFAAMCMSCRQRAVAADTSAVRVAAASDLAVALPKLNEVWHAQSASSANFTFAASRKLGEQIAQGADFDVALLAGPNNLERTIATGRCAGSTRIRIGAGPLVIVARSGRTVPTQMTDLAAAETKFVSLANPAHAPFGIAAMQALRAAGVAEALGGRLVEAESVRQALAQVDSGASDYALVALALVYERPPGTYWRVPNALYEKPVVEALRCSDRTGAQQFLAFLQSAEAVRELHLAGFE
jgi:molybdate transport system substrate-binding protein